MSFFLAGYLKRNASSNEASLKYVIYGAFSSGIMLYGLSILFGLTGTTNFFVMQEAVAALGPESNLALILATVFILVGFGYKISAVPFHFWTLTYTRVHQLPSQPIYLLLQRLPVLRSS